MKKRLLLIPCLLGASLLSGCGVAYTEKPIGESPVVLDPGEWDGVWTTEGAPCFVAVVNAEEGILQLCAMERDEETGKLESQHILIHLRKTGRQWFGTLVEEGKDCPYFEWVLVKKDDSQVIIWAPDGDKFEELIKGGELPGRMCGEEKEVPVLTELSAEHYERMLRDPSEFLFDWTEPLVFNRVIPVSF